MISRVGDGCGGTTAAGTYAARATHLTPPVLARAVHATRRAGRNPTSRPARSSDREAHFEKERYPMKTSPYPYAPLRSRYIPGRFQRAVFEYGVELALAGGKPSEKSNHLADVAYELEERTRADMLRLEAGPLEAVAR